LYREPFEIKIIVTSSGVEMLVTIFIRYAFKNHLN